MADSDQYEGELDVALEALPAVSLTVTDQFQGLRVEMRWGEAATAPPPGELVVLARMLTRAPTPLEAGLARVDRAVAEEQRLRLVEAAHAQGKPST
jgi:hypothetical protein